MFDRKAAPQGQVLVRFLLLLLLVVAAVGVVGYAMGWITLESTSDRTTIEIDKNEMKDAGRKAAEETEEFVDEVGETLREAGEAISNDSSDEGSDEPDRVETVPNDAPPDSN
jgi:hypothetical protein